MPFFLRGPRAERQLKGKKRKQPPGNRNIDKSKRAPTKPPKEDLDEEITSDEDDFIQKQNHFSHEDVDESLEEETPQEKKARLAQQYLQELRIQKAAESDDDADETSTNLALSQILRDQVLESAGRLYKPLANSLSPPDCKDIRILKCKQQKLPVTCIAVTADGQYIFSGSKDSTIVKWAIDGKKMGIIPRGQKGIENQVNHITHICSIAVSTDSKFLASGDQKGFINIWNAETLQHLKRFKKNNLAISGLVFRQGTTTLYSCSHDRNVMVWNLDVMGFVEHLGGHASAITGIDALNREACITCGGRDETVIIYQIVEDKQLIFNGRQNSIDGIKLLNDKTFVTYGQDGSIALWTTLKKKPHYVIKEAHGREENQQPRWLTAITAIVNSDVVATGSSDGFIRFWKAGVEEEKKLTTLFSIPVNGIINSLAFTTSGSHLIAGVGQEHKSGRWYKDKTCKNSVVIIPINKLNS